MWLLWMMGALLAALWALGRIGVYQIGPWYRLFLIGALLMFIAATWMTPRRRGTP